VFDLDIVDALAAGQICGFHLYSHASSSTHSVITLRKRDEKVTSMITVKVDLTTQEFTLGRPNAVDERDERELSHLCEQEEHTSQGCACSSERILAVTFLSSRLNEVWQSGKQSTSYSIQY
jgi:hypothetical protein